MELYGSILDTFLAYQITLFIIMNSIWLALYFSFRNKQYRQWSKMPAVSIVIPVYNKVNLIKQTILSALSVDYPKKEVIVVDDFSTDGSKDICKEFAKKKKIKLIEHKHNMGKAAALNSGVKAAKNSIIVTVDADSFPKKNSLKRLVRHFADPKVGAVAGTIKAAQSKTILTAYQCLEYFSQGFQRLCQGFINAIMVAPGPLTAYRKEALAKAGYFDNDTVVEDFDMTIKIQKNGYKVVSEKKAESLTVVPDTLGTWKKQRIRWSRGSIQIFKKHADVFSNKNTRSLAMFSFPMAVFWMIMPYIMLSTYVIIAVRNLMLTIQNFNLNIFFNISLLLRIKSIYELYIEIERYLIAFFNITNLNNTLILGYISVFIFLVYTVFSFKSLKENFKPKDLRGLTLISIYWFMLMFIHIYATFVELFKRKSSW